MKKRQDFCYEILMEELTQKAPQVQISYSVVDRISNV
jgi:hypothetical protein